MNETCRRPQLNENLLRYEYASLFAPHATLSIPTAVINMRLCSTHQSPLHCPTLAPHLTPYLIATSFQLRRFAHLLQFTWNDSVQNIQMRLSVVERVFSRTPLAFLFTQPIYCCHFEFPSGCLYTYWFSMPAPLLCSLSSLQLNKLNEASKQQQSERRFYLNWMTVCLPVCRLRPTWAVQLETSVQFETVRCLERNTRIARAFNIFTRRRGAIF